MVSNVDKKRQHITKYFKHATNPKIIKKRPKKHNLDKYSTFINLKGHNRKFQGHN